jgi:S1-C subfamily serine protease
MIVDVVIALLFFSALLRGRELGFVRQILSAIGFFGGLFLGAAIGPHVVDLAHSQLSRALLTLVITLGSAIVLLSLGEYIGIVLKHKLERYQHLLNSADAVLGAVAGTASLLLTVWLIAPVLVRLPFPALQNAVRQSTIVSYLDTTLPTIPNVMAGLGHLINPNGFPEVFTGIEPTPPANVPLPNLGTMEAAVKKDEASVVKIEGEGCGGVVEGSGFVAGKGFVTTNAHVVAGITNPYVVDGNGTHRATVVWFDPNLDFAVLRVSHLAGSALTIDTGHVPQKTPGAVLGYPGGGGFTAGPATVLQEFTAEGRNIYNQGATSRDVYEVKATIIPGNSGGPLIEQNGSVIGVVFAESTTYNQIGYALATQKVASELKSAERSSTPVSTGSCAQ